MEPRKPCNCGHGISYHLVRTGCALCNCKEFLKIGWEVNVFG